MFHLRLDAAADSTNTSHSICDEEGQENVFGSGKPIAKEEVPAAWKLIPGDFGPGAGLRAFLDGFAKDEFVVACIESRKRARCFVISGVEISVKVFEELNESVRIAFRVSARVRCITARGGTEEGRILY